MSLLKNLKDRAEKSNRIIVLPESEDPRVLKAARKILQSGNLSLILIGDPGRIKTLDPFLKSSRIRVHNWEEEPKKSNCIDFIRRKNQKKSLSEKDAEEMLQDPLVYAGTLIAMGEADGAVAGSLAITASVIRAGIRTVGVHPNSELVSSVFLMALKDGRILTYSDCAVVPYPDVNQLCSIALDAGNTHRKLTSREPRIAFLSFSSKGSASHERVDLVRQAAARASGLKKEWVIDGELQFDAAFIPEIASSKVPDSPLQGSASVFIFPNLDAGNIAYKITERLAGAVAIGPILQGLSKPYLDLSRGCSTDDIVNSVYSAAVLSQ